MLNVREYHRPTSVDAALSLLLRPVVRSVALAGGTHLVGTDAADVEAVVDLQDLQLSHIRADTDSVHIGAMTRLEELADSPLTRALAGGLVARAAHGSTTSVLRHQATLGGSLVAAVNADVVAALLVLDAEAMTLVPGERRFTLWEFCRDPRAVLAGGLLIEVQIRVPPAATGAAYHKVARTPADQAIVGIAARLGAEAGRCSQVRLAAFGIGPAPVRLEEAEAALQGQVVDEKSIAAAADAARGAVVPIEDFRASAEYRREMVSVLTTRAVRDAWENID